MGDFRATNNVLDAIRGQIEDQLGGEAELVDEVFIFDGALSQAIVDHFGGKLGASKHAFVFVAQTAVLANQRAGDGSALYSDRTIDCYVVVRTTGKTRYTKDRERLYDISDAMWNTVFFHTERTDDFNELVAQMQPESITRQPSGQDVIAHLIRFTCVPKRT